MPVKPSGKAGGAGLLLGLDIGTSSIKASVLDSANGHCLGSASAPPSEMAVNSPHAGFAEQDPEEWWTNVRTVIAELGERLHGRLADVTAIGITYQMHGLVLVDKDFSVLRPAIIWCDSRAVEIGHQARQDLGEAVCRGRLLNSPGNFTASKLRWVMQHEPTIYGRAWKAMLPGDYIAARLTGEVATTASGLSKMILWDYAEGSPATAVLDYFGIAPELLPSLAPTFGEQGRLRKIIADELGLRAGIPVTYRAGDQPNNAFALSALEPGEVAATAGTSGVVYGICDAPSCDSDYRVNTFLHVNHRPDAPRLGVLLCLNGCGILNRWCRHQLMGGDFSYEAMNRLASETSAGIGGTPQYCPMETARSARWATAILAPRSTDCPLMCTPARMCCAPRRKGLYSRLFTVWKSWGGWVCRRAQFARGTRTSSGVSLFVQMFATLSGATVEVFATDGLQGAARGAGIGAGVYSGFKEAFSLLQVIQRFESNARLRPDCILAYENWRSILEQTLEKMPD